MKKRKHTIHLMLILLLGVLIGSVGAKEYKVKYLNGVVEVKKAGQAAWQLATLQMKIAEGDSIRTQQESSVELEDDQGQVLKIGETRTTALTQNLSSLAQTKQTTRKATFLERLRKLSGSQADFRVTSPTAVAAIRGKAAAGFGFNDVNGDGIDDNLIDEDLTGLSSTNLGVNESRVLDSYNQENRGRHGIHNEVRPTHWDNIRCLEDPKRCPLP